MIRNFMFEDRFIYSFDEACETFLLNTMSPHPTFPLKTGEDVLRGLLSIGYVGYNGLTHKFDTNYNELSFVSTENNELVCSDKARILLNKIKLRYGTHIALNCPSSSDDDKLSETRNLFKKIFNLIDYTYFKYSTLLEEYESQKSHLLDKLSRIRSGNRQLSQEAEHSEESNKLSLYNDTPQTTDVVATIEGNQYVSDLTKGRDTNEGTNSSSGTDEYEETETWDNVPIMARLEEIEKKLSNLWKKWLNEFDELFVEEVNY